MPANSSQTPHRPRRTPEPSGSGSRAGVITLATLGVLVIAGCAILLSYNGIYQIAVQGGMSAELAHLYPGLFTLLLMMAFWTTYLLRAAPLARRIWVDALVLVLILLAAGGSAMRALDYRLLDWVATVVVAVGPWVALLVAFRLLLWIVVELRGERVRPRRPRPRSPEQPSEPTGDLPEAHPTQDIDWKNAEDTTQVLRREGTPATAPALTPRGEPEPEPALAVPPVPREAPEAPTPAERGEEMSAPPATPAPEPAEEHRFPVEARDEPVAAEQPAEQPAEQEPEQVPPPGPAPVPETVDVPDQADVPGTKPAPAPVSAEELPKRTPAEGGGVIKRAAGSPEPLQDAGAARERAEALNRQLETDDGFDPDPVPDDPAGDEAYEAPVEAEQRPAETPAHAVGPSSPPVEPVRKRPMVLKPRKSPGVPAEPPSWRVRSAPTPPKD
ncbi:DUF2637 domain-containing protein [Nocardiopsis ansamitocini]|uniref:DUF2637 domain-containing protein n=1 Tax=Nocardiopsis ansamitocini TaxID=1670832 RepID=A0A9W6P5A6_9ACTN|nr:DUF2637 domain-containing protein [Nocardiopsis ansamitocini]GLU47411.1 hypothetical protein Nans01_17620 [Nocardiopsis ansamitocini]